MSYKIRLDIFEGPLDLLLYLIKKNDIDITNIPITKITEQYMEYIEMMKMLDLDVVGDFLVMAATLMHIKSKMLLPPDPSDEVSQDPRQELANRLLEYQQFKEVADTLQTKESERKDLLARMVDEEEKKRLIDESQEVYFEASLFDLINALSDALKRTPEEVIHEIVADQFTVDRKIHDILHLLLNKTSVTLQQLFAKAQNKMEIIVTFLAVLELIRLKEITAFQRHVFADIEIERNKENMIPEQKEEQKEIE